MERASIDIYKRISIFVLEIIKFTRTLPKNQEALIFSRQLIRSGSSIGANAHEADGSNSRKDFINKLSIARKEAKECEYWLNLIGQAYPDLLNSSKILQEEVVQLIKILSTIIKKSSEVN